MADQPIDMIVPLLQALRSEISEMRDDVKGLKADVKDIKADLRGMKLQTIAEIYKANLTVASFAELSDRLRRVEEAVFPQAS
jgi:hypothetical protein